MDRFDNSEQPRAAAPSGGPIIGGLPWAPPTAAQPVRQVESRAAAPVRFKRSRSSSVADRLRELFRRSPAFSASLSAHIVLLLLLAVWVVRREAGRDRILELTFSDAGQPMGLRVPEAVEIRPASEAAAAVEPPEKKETKPIAAAVRPVEPKPETEIRTPQPAASPEPDKGTGESRTPITAGLSGRGEDAKAALLAASGGTAGTERAVELALGWLARNAEKPDGLWRLTGPYEDGGNQENRLAASAMALLALQGAGTTPSSGRHAAVVDRAWKSLLKRQRDDGTFQLGAIPDQHSLYSHAQATIALCEALGMTRDERFLEPARRAVRYALAAQMPDGGWRYRPPEPNHENKGDMSVTGWFLMALKTAEMAGLDVPAETYTRLESFLDNVFISDEKGFNYQINPLQKVVDFRPAITAEGLLCRQYLGWGRDHPQLQAGIDRLLAESPLDMDGRTRNVYAWYYQTQVFHHAGGRAWESWNKELSEQLPAKQVRSGREAGSWDRANDQWGHIGGRLYVTCLSTLMLEAYYRHMPIHGGPR